MRIAVWRITSGDAKRNSAAPLFTNTKRVSSRRTHLARGRHDRSKLCFEQFDSNEMYLVERKPWFNNSGACTRQARGNDTFHISRCDEAPWRHRTKVDQSSCNNMLTRTRNTRRSSTTCSPQASAGTIPSLFNGMFAAPRSCPCICDLHHNHNSGSAASQPSATEY